MMKKSARHIFNTCRMDMSDTSLKAMEAQVLEYCRTEVEQALFFSIWCKGGILQILNPGKGWPRRFEVEFTIK